MADRDIELNILNLKEDSLAHGSSYSMREPVYDIPRRPGAVQRWLDTFRRDPTQRITPKGIIGDDGIPMHMRDPHGGHYYDIRAANIRTANSGLLRELKGRHLQMIAIGGSIGTGLFVASGKALNTGGPASVLIAYLFIGVMLYCTVQALGELAVVFPVAGSFSAYSTRFLDPAWGFAMGWNYALQWLVVLPLEIIAAAITIEYWNDSLDKAIFVTIFLATIITINLFGVKGYGEAEFVFAIIKVTAVIGFILLGVVINIGGKPGGGYIGGSYWHDPGAFHNGFKGLCSVFVTAAFAFAGTELVGLAAAETQNPRKSLPTAIKQVFWRISLFYVVALTLVGVLVRYDDTRLLGTSSSDSKASPFVVAIQDAGIDVLPGVMNAVILVAVMSVGNSAVFGSSRTLAALADQGQAPKIFGYIDRRGRPLVAIVLASLIGFLAYLSDTEEQSDVMDWLMAISGLSSIFTWGSICLAHIRFRKAWRRKGRSLHELAFRAQAGVAGSWVGLTLNGIVLVAQFWVGAWPLGYADQSAAANVQNFFLQYMAVPIVLLFWLAYKLYYRTSIVRVDDMDIDTGRRDFNLPILMAQEMEEKRAWPRWKKLYRFFC
ncbi:putative general amino-acid permease gap1 protein [Phaeoacremonium minimum UCRPA7]|uniref:Putative general amino-acid permease gap1 protein n=1 Tax=Phaeoacremonium minimum (strain UCR-PA7) TaxID=1286976 RepID=R8BD71_PHAM7|nr:putative general amino-acid permease gap1 protein [Phaeoacremonium minimum UCRPA7]EON97241.1 putative general amino-acid permease gap1 protein [Phaeoacremonium minimum UCRPA7]